MHAQIEPTTRCNLSCPICCGRHMQQADLDYETFKEIISKLPNLKEVLLQGEGEPLLHKDFFLMVKHLKSLGIMVSTITNGTLLTHEMSQRLIASGIDDVGISLDTLDQQAMDKIKPDICVKLLVRNIAVLSSVNYPGLKPRGFFHAPSLNRKTRLGMVSNVFRDNADETTKLIDFAVENNLDYVIRKPLLKMEYYSRHYSSAVASRLIPQEEDKEAKSYAKNKGVELIVSGRGCWRISQSIFINVKGNVTPCCYMKDLSFGNILKNTLPEIIKHYKHVRTSLQTGHIPQECLGCCHLS